MEKLPFPTKDNTTSGLITTRTAAKVPWRRVNTNEPPPLMFQVQFCDGRNFSFAYCDLREVRLRDAGSLQLRLLGMEKYHVTIEGRNLKELANLFVTGKIKSLEELGPRTFELPECEPSIDKITVETLTGPAY